MLMGLCIYRESLYMYRMSTTTTALATLTAVADSAGSDNEVQVSHYIVFKYVCMNFYIR
jgi:hypothetical protein